MIMEWLEMKITLSFNFSNLILFSIPDKKKNQEFLVPFLTGVRYTSTKIQLIELISYYVI